MGSEIDQEILRKCRGESEVSRKTKFVYKLDDAGKEAAKAIVAEWSDYAFRTGPMTTDERETVKDAVEALFRAGGKTPPPRHVS